MMIFSSYYFFIEIFQPFLYLMVCHFEIILFSYLHFFHLLDLFGDDLVTSGYLLFFLFPFFCFLRSQIIASFFANLFIFWFVLIFISFELIIFIFSFFQLPGPSIFIYLLFLVFIFPLPPFFYFGYIFIFLFFFFHPHLKTLHFFFYVDSF